MAETFFDKIYKNKTLHTPDVLSCLANLSNDEVFTPPDVVNQMLDLLLPFWTPHVKRACFYAKLPSGCSWGQPIRYPICRSEQTISSTSNFTALQSRNSQVCYLAVVYIAQNIQTVNTRFLISTQPKAIYDFTALITFGQTGNVSFAARPKRNGNAKQEKKPTPTNLYTRPHRRKFLI